MTPNCAHIETHFLLSVQNSYGSPGKFNQIFLGCTNTEKTRYLTTLAVSITRFVSDSENDTVSFIDFVRVVSLCCNRLLTTDGNTSVECAAFGEGHHQTYRG